MNNILPTLGLTIEQIDQMDDRKTLQELKLTVFDEIKNMETYIHLSQKEHGDNIDKNWLYRITRKKAVYEKAYNHIKVRLDILSDQFYYNYFQAAKEHLTAQQHDDFVNEAKYLSHLE